MSDYDFNYAIQALIQPNVIDAEEAKGRVFDQMISIETYLDKLDGKQDNALSKGLVSDEIKRLAGLKGAPSWIGELADIVNSPNFGNSNTGSFEVNNHEAMSVAATRIVNLIDSDRDGVLSAKEQEGLNLENLVQNAEFANFVKEVIFQKGLSECGSMVSGITGRGPDDKCVGR